MAARTRPRPKTSTQAGNGGLPAELRRRVVIEGVSPEVDEGRRAAKATLGRPVRVEADVFADGHEVLAGRLQFRRENDPEWTEIALRPLANDRWCADFPVTGLGMHLFTLRAWVDAFATWRCDLEKRLAAGPTIAVPTITMEGDANGAPHVDPGAYAKKFVGKYSHRLIKGGIGHNLPQEAPQEFADAVIEVAQSS